MPNLIHAFSELLANGKVVIASNQVKEFNKCANAHKVKYEIGPHISGQSVLITI